MIWFDVLWEFSASSRVAGRCLLIVSGKGNTSNAPIIPDMPRIMKGTSSPYTLPWKKNYRKVHQINKKKTIHFETNEASQINLELNMVTRTTNQK